MADGLDDMSDEMEGNGGSSEPGDFYAAEVAKYEAIVDDNLDASFKRYGFTLYHSLPGLKQIEIAQKLGFQKRDAVDYYNLASLDISRDEYGAAVKNLQKALELDGSMADAAFNLALCYEKLNKKQDALNQWSRYIELSDNTDERAEVETHLAELKG
jgi:tetratricopeptide (TPR) repeat protein